MGSERTVSRLGVALLVSCCGLARADDVLPVGSELQINSFTTGFQGFADVAVAPSGEGLVVWVGGASPGTDTSDTSIVARRLDASGEPTGSDFQVNAHTTGGQTYASVAAAGSGFLVVWHDARQEPGLSTIVGRRVDLDGTMLGSDFQVAPATTVEQLAPLVAARPSGDFVVAWTQTRTFPSGTTRAARRGVGPQVRALRVDAAGAPIGAILEVTNDSVPLRVATTVATGPDGTFVVGWSDGEYCHGYGCSVMSAKARRYASGGTEIGAELRLAGPLPGPYELLPMPDATSLGDAGFALAWEELPPGPDPRSSDLRATRVPAAGEPAGSSVRISPLASTRAGDPAIARLSGDTAVAVFEGRPEGGGAVIEAVALDPDGGARSAPRLLNADVPVPGSAGWLRPKLAALADGSMLVVWLGFDSSVPAVDGAEVRARRLARLAFRGDFEDGDTAQWAVTVRSP